MKIEEIARRFNAVPNGPGKWKARCPIHGDENPSLTISPGENGKILVGCLVGCETADILRAVGLKFSDLFDGPANDGTQKPFHKYGLKLEDYASAKKLDPQLLHDQAGLYTGTKVSHSGKPHPGVVMPYWDREGNQLAIRWRMRLEKEKGGEPSRFIWEKGAKLCLYGLWRLQAKYWPKEYPRKVLIVEGESDCHSLWQAGFDDLAVLGLPGAANYKPERDDPELQGFDEIYIHIEKDSGGKKLFETFAGIEGDDRHKPSALIGKIRFFSLPGYKDPSDAWQSLHENPQEFRNLMARGMISAQKAADYQKPKEWAEKEKRAKASAANGEKGGRPQTDYIGAADAFASYWRTPEGIPTLRYWRNAWYQFNGQCYKPKMDSDLENQCVAFLQNRQVAADFHIQPSTSAVKNIIMGMRSVNHCGIPAEMEMPSWIHSGERADGWVAVANRLINIEQAAKIHLEAFNQRRLPTPAEIETYTRPLTPDMLSTFSFDYNYDPHALCPNFDCWLATTLPDPEIQAVCRMLMGLALIPDTTYNICWFLAGEGGTGKSTFLDILQALVGFQNTCRVPLLKFEEKFSIWPLTESLLNIVGEMPTDDPQGRLRYIEGDFKDSISGGMMTVERKGKDVCQARCTARHVFATNSLPIFFDKSEGIWDRLIIIPFEQRFRGTASEIRNFKEKIIPSELPGIFNEALLGLAQLRQYTRFPEPTACRLAKQWHRDRCDFDASYLREHYAPAEACEVSLAEAYKQYADTLRENGLGVRSSPTFQQAVYRIFGIRPTKKSKDDTRRVFKGLAALGQFNTGGNTMNF